MKKVLFATTALVLSAGVAAAEVSVSGNGRMGVVYSGQTPTTGNDWQFSSRIRAVFTLSGTTDGGLEFGGTFRADNAVGAAAGSAGTVFIKGAFGTLTMGDVASAPEALFGDLASVGYMGDSQTTGELAVIGTNDIPYLTLDNGTTSALQYVFTSGPWSVAAAMSDGVAEDLDLDGDDDQQYSVAASYTFGNYLVGLGYEKVKMGTTVAGATDMHQWELAAAGTFGNTSVKAYYADGEIDGGVAAGIAPVTFAAGALGTAVDHKAYGLGVSSVFGATTVNGYVQHLKANTLGSITWYGVGVDYDLGGGAVLSAGIQDDNGFIAAGVKTKAVANVGVRFTF